MELFRSALRSRNSMIAIRLPEAGARGDLTSDHVAWQYYRNVPQLPSPLVYRGILYMINDRGIVTTFEPTSGEVKKAESSRGCRRQLLRLPGRRGRQDLLCVAFGKHRHRSR